ncbi:MFS transporter [Desertihabitans brevis]|uniref:MFS transporter n=1 Tax=Desertihabitans brevis TaxID=2268447 RepID=A0A367YRU2_9ACTN|nr:MFS transporter [Desertihabitans brevis]RCK68554.1 MFS transporter [Desertihabitans brevis]
MQTTAGVRRWLRGRSELPRSVLVLGLISFSVAVGFGVMVPVLPVYAQSFGVGTFEASAVISAFALVRLVTAPVVGPLIDRLGERPVLVTGVLVVAGSTALAALATSYWPFLVLRGIGGLGSAMFTVSSMTLLLNTVEPRLRGRAAGFFQGGFLLGGMAGPAIGGALAGISLTAPFWFYAATLAVAGLIGLVVLRSSERGRDAAGTEEVRPMSAVLADPRYQAALVAGLGQGWTSFGVRSALVPLLVVGALGAEPAWTGIAFAVSAVVQTIALAPVGRFVDTVGRRPAMVAGGLVCAAATTGVSFSTDLVVLVVSLAVYGLGAALLGTAPAAAVGDAAGGRSGTPVAVFSMVGDLGAIVGPLLAGWIADQGSYPLAFGVGSAIFVLGSLLALRMPRGVPAAPAGSGTATAP